MELRDVFGVFARYKKLFWVLCVLPFVVVAIAYLVMPQYLVTTATLTVLRTEIEGEVEQFGVDQYDSFYRIEADDAIAKTIAAWLATPQVVVEIGEKSGNVQYLQTHPSKHYETKQRASHVIDVEFPSKSGDDAQKEVQALTESVNQRLSLLGGEQQQRSWFKVVSEKPYAEPFAYNLILLLVLATVFGISLAVMGVVFYHYVRSEPEESKE